MAATERQQRHDESKAGQARTRRLLRAYIHPPGARARLLAAPRAVPPDPARPADPARPDERAIFKALVGSAPWWQRGYRRMARRLAERRADQELTVAQESHSARLDAYRAAVDVHQQQVTRAQQEREAEQRLLDYAHDRIAAGDLDACTRSIEQALLKIPFATKLSGWDEGRPVVVVGAIELKDVPEDEPSHTPTGKPTVRKLPKGERNDLHAELIAAAVLAVATTTLTAVPSAPSVIVAAQTDRGWVAVAEVPRRPLAGAPLAALAQLDGAIGRSGRTREVCPLASDQHVAFGVALLR